MQKLVFKCDLSLGDIVLLTAAVRDLHRTHPGLFQTDVRTPFPELWLHNPWVTPLDEYGADVRVVPCRYPLIDRSDEVACHVLHGFLDFLNQYLGARLTPTECRGDIHLSRAERRAPGMVEQWVRRDLPYWLVSSGGKYDCTVKWWDARRYQEVVNHLQGRVQFVQVGHPDHHHPPLDGVIDLRGQTTVRDLVRLIYHAQGVLCGVTGLMHLAAAVPVKSGQASLRPCVVIAGGRESPVWEAYPGHQFVHTVGALPCCARGGCWRSRVLPLGDGAPQDRKAELCVDVAEGLPRCMTLIESGEVVRRIERYFAGGVARSLTRAEARAAARGVAATAGRSVPRVKLHWHNARAEAERFIATIPAYPGGFAGRGVVICGGGVKMFTNAWVALHMLRRVGCTLPIELWYLGPREMDPEMQALVEPLGARCRDAMSLRAREGQGELHGWALKAYALVHSAFEEVLLLDADNMPVRNPEYLFDARPFRRTGAVFWPDYGHMAPERSAWRAFDVPYRDEPEFESGQLLVRKRACWRALVLALWYNEHPEFYYQHVYGDKDTFHMAFRKLGLPYAMPSAPLRSLIGNMCQHDFEGRLLFQHRNGDKWTLFPINQRLRGFLFEDDCRRDLEELRRRWDARLARIRPAAPRASAAAQNRRVRAGEPTVFAFMTSCAERDNLRAHTLDRLRATDWGDHPVQVFLDERRFPDKVDNITHTAWRALQAAWRNGAEYALYLEDDLLFNAHFRHNLLAWPLLRDRAVHLGSLYNPGLPEVAWDVPNWARYIGAQSLYGSQALVLHRAFIGDCLKRWRTGPNHVDRKLAFLASQRFQCLPLHAPSLVQHIGRASTWGGSYHRAVDFRRDWKAAPA
jgi:ADP-heptose:LPS heptosyltransferase